MSEKIKTETTVESPPDSPSSPVIVQAPTNPSAEQVIEAAIQTGKAAQQATEAAEEAGEKLEETERLLNQTREMVREELRPIVERLTVLETPITPDEREDTQTIVSANGVEIEEPEPLKPEEIPPATPPIQNPERGGFLRKLFLNL